MTITAREDVRLQHTGIGRRYLIEGRYIMLYYIIVMTLLLGASSARPVYRIDYHRVKTVDGSQFSERRRDVQIRTGRGDRSRPRHRSRRYASRTPRRIAFPVRLRCAYYRLATSSKTNNEIKLTCVVCSVTIVQCTLSTPRV